MIICLKEFNYGLSEPLKTTRLEDCAVLGRDIQLAYIRDKSSWALDHFLVFVFALNLPPGYLHVHKSHYLCIISYSSLISSVFIFPFVFLRDLMDSQRTGNRHWFIIRWSIYCIFLFAYKSYFRAFELRNSRTLEIQRRLKHSTQLTQLAFSERVH